MWIVLLGAVATFAQGSPYPGLTEDIFADRIVINSDDGNCILASVGKSSLGETVLFFALYISFCVINRG